MEQTLIEDLVIESIRIFGVDCYYIPRIKQATTERLRASAAVVSSIAEGMVSSLNILTNGRGYLSAPSLTFSAPTAQPAAQIKFGTSAATLALPTQQAFVHTFTEDVTDNYEIGFWIYPTDLTTAGVIAKTSNIKIYQDSLGYVTFNADNQEVTSDIPLAFQFWNFVLIEVKGGEVKVHVNDSYNSAGASVTDATMSGTLSLGYASAITNPNSGPIDAVSGYIDNFFMNIDVTDVKSPPEIEIPNDIQTGTLFTKNFDLETAEGYATIARGIVNGVFITNPGEGYITPPVVSVQSVESVNGNQSDHVAGGYDDLLNEDDLPFFNGAYEVEMYVKNVDGFEGEGDFLSKFGLQIRDSMTLTVAMRTWEQEVGGRIEDQRVRPYEGDLIFFPLNKKVFKIMHVEHEAIFYQMGALQTYDLRCELFEYSNEIIETGVEEIDEIFIPLMTMVDVDGDGQYTAVANVSSVETVSADNWVIETEGDNILDFTEENPFGESNY